MTKLLIVFILFLISGKFMLKAYKATKKDSAVFISITTLGAALWASIILRHPLDLNEAIAWVLSRFQ